MKRQHILVIRFSSLGDVAMTVPVVYAVARCYPDTRITVLSRSYARPLFEDLAPNVNFMAADIKGEYRGLRGLNALYRRLVAKQFTHVADLHSVLRSGYLRLRFNLGHFKVNHIDKHRSSRRRLVAQKGKVRRQLPTSFENYLKVFRQLGFPVEGIGGNGTPIQGISGNANISGETGDSIFRSLFPPEGGNLNLLPRAVGEKRSWEQWIGIAPFAAHQGKIYPKEKMLEVIRLLIARYPKARFFLFGRGKEEEEAFAQWVAQLPQCIDVGRNTESLHQELILMSHLDVMLSMDSANMHLASLTATTVVSIWGATDPLAGFLGWRQSRENAISANLDCRPCSIYGQKPCRYGDYRCMAAITPETIAGRVAAIIDGKSKNNINP